MDVTLGGSAGVLLIGVDPRPAFTPHASVSFEPGYGISIWVRDHANLLPAINRLGIGIYNQTSVDLGYAWESGDISLGPSLSIYGMPACSPKQCGRVVGWGPGGHVQYNGYFAGPVGVSLSANVDWVGGQSPLLPGTLTVMLIGGLLVRWHVK